MPRSYGGPPRAATCTSYRSRVTRKILNSLNSRLLLAKLFQMLNHSKLYYVESSKYERIQHEHAYLLLALV